jgi:hypothetical protein
MASNHIKSQRNAIYDAMRECEKTMDKLSDELIDLQATCPHEDKRTFLGQTICYDCDKEFFDSATDDNAVT